MLANLSVSVIIPAYNQGRFLRDAIDSALRQRPRPQVIVVDDGSVDETETVCEAFGDNIVSIRKSNGGVSSARNAGLLAATGDIVVFLDADDMLADGWLNRVVRAAGETSQVLNAWYGDLVLFSAQNGLAERAAGPKTLPARRRIRTRALWRDSILVPSGVAVTTSVINEVGYFDSAVDSCEDWDYWLRCVQRGVRFTRLAGLSAFHREHPDSVSHSGTLALDRRVRFLKYWLGSGRLTARGSSVMRQELARTYLRYVRALLGEDKRAAEEWLGLALASEPSLGANPMLVVFIALRATTFAHQDGRSFQSAADWLLELHGAGWPIEARAVAAGRLLMKLAVSARKRPWHCLADASLLVAKQPELLLPIARHIPQLVSEARRARAWWST